MKPMTPVFRLTLIAVALVGASLILVSWNFQGNAFHFTGDKQYSDTVPPKKAKADREKKVRNLDEAIEELENVNIDAEMKNAMKEVEKAMKEFDASKIHLELEKALKDVDMKKIQEELRESLAKVDGEKIKADVQKALSEIDFSKIKTELEQSLKGMDMEKLKMELNMEKMKEEMKDMEKELRNIGPEIEKSLKDAKVEIEKAKVELKEYKGFVDGLEKDGLISKKDGYKLKHKDGELFINGKKQSSDVYNKYRSFLEKHKSFNIDDEAGDDFNIDID
jgi:multidrug efflux pump subunit AcrB